MDVLIPVKDQMMIAKACMSGGNLRAVTMIQFITKILWNTTILDSRPSATQRWFRIIHCSCVHSTSWSEDIGKGVYLGTPDNCSYVPGSEMTRFSRFRVAVAKLGDLGGTFDIDCAFAWLSWST
jgi:hypothetical protein